MSNHDFIPAKDEDFDGFQSQLVTYLTPNAVTWGIALANPDYVDLLAKQTDWAAKFAAGRKSAMPAHPLVVAKQTSRHNYEKAIRLFNKRYLISNGAIADSDKASLGITIADTVRTRSHVPDYAPQADIHKIEHLVHIIRIVDPTHPDTKEMPDGTIGANVFVSITPPVGPSALPDPATFYFIGLSHKFDFDAAWASTYVGKTAYYYAQYVDVHGQAGPASPVFSAVIA